MESIRVIFFLPTRSLTVLYFIALHVVIDPALIMIGRIYLITFVLKRLQVPPISGGGLNFIYKIDCCCCC